MPSQMVVQFVPDTTPDGYTIVVQYIGPYMGQLKGGGHSPLLGVANEHGAHVVAGEAGGVAAQPRLASSSLPSEFDLMAMYNEMKKIFEVGRKVKAQA